MNGMEHIDNWPQAAAYIGIAFAVMGMMWALFWGLTR